MSNLRMSRQQVNRPYSTRPRRPPPRGRGAEQPPRRPAPGAPVRRGHHCLPGHRRHLPRHWRLLRRGCLGSARGYMRRHITASRCSWPLRKARPGLVLVIGAKLRLLSTGADACWTACPTRRISITTSWWTPPSSTSTRWTYYRHMGDDRIAEFARHGGDRRSGNWS
jgi:hypothetical protein